MTITSDIEKDTKANFAVAEVIEDSVSAPPTVAEASVAGTSATKAATFVTVERSVLELATAVDTEDSDKRKADLCCGSCCDFVKACVVVDIIWIVFSLLGILLSVMGFSVLNSISPEDLDDDDIIQDIEEIQDQLNTTYAISMGLTGVSLVFAIIGLVGASKFNKTMVLITGIWLFFEAFLGALLLQNFVGAVMSLFFMYPHFGLFHAIKKGQITRETYDRERYCCCDGPAR